jgi:hypothetical protein
MRSSPADVDLDAPPRGIRCLDAATLKTTRTPPALRDRLRAHVAPHVRQEPAASP